MTELNRRVRIKCLGFEPSRLELTPSECRRCVSVGTHCPELRARETRNRTPQIAQENWLAGPWGDWLGGRDSAPKSRCAKRIALRRKTGRAATSEASEVAGCLGRVSQPAHPRGVKASPRCASAFVLQENGESATRTSSRHFSQIEQHLQIERRELAAPFKNGPEELIKLLGG